MTTAGRRGLALMRTTTNRLLIGMFGCGMAFGWQHIKLYGYCPIFLLDRAPSFGFGARPIFDAGIYFTCQSFSLVVLTVTRPRTEDL